MTKGIHIELGCGISLYWNYRPANSAIGTWFLNTEKRAPRMYGFSVGWSFVGVTVYRKEKK